MDPVLSLPSYTVEIVRHVPPMWFIFSMTGLSFLFLAVANASYDDEYRMKWLTALSIVAMTASAPYVYAVTPYAVIGYLYVLIASMLGYLMTNLLTQYEVSL